MLASADSGRPEAIVDYDAPVALADPFGLIGQILDAQFRVDALVGEGGFSAVYRGTHLGLGEPIAIKCLKLPPSVWSPPEASATDPLSAAPATPVMGTVLVDTFVKRFRDESRILYRLGQGNLNVVRCIASGTTLAPATGALVPYMVLEWLEGQSLDADLESRAGRGRTLPETMSLLEPVADAMTHAHAMGVVHRDLSTGNIFLAKQRDGSLRAKVLDFGVAKVMTDDLDLGPRTQTIAQIRIFSPAYAAPEQFDSRIAPPGPYSDVYSLALVAVEVLAGRTVREASSLGDMMQRALEESAPRTPRALGVNVPDAVEQVFARALSIDATKRQKDVSELWRELRGAQSMAAIPGRPSMDLGTTARQPVPPPHAPAEASGTIEHGPTTQRLATSPPNFDSLKSTVRLPSSPPPAPPVIVNAPRPAARAVTEPMPMAAFPRPSTVVDAVPGRLPTTMTSQPNAPPPAASASSLFQALAVPPPPGAPLPAASGSFAAFKATERSVTTVPIEPNTRAPEIVGKPTVAPLSARSTQRAQWLVGLLVFIIVLAAGGAALRFWILR